MEFKISIVTTIDLKYRPYDILKKLYRMIKFATDDVEIIICHQNRGCFFDKLLPFLVKRCNFNVVSILSDYQSPIKNAALRNKGARLAKSKYLLFYDIDLYFDSLFINSICNDYLPLEKGMIFPCVYLTKFGTRKILSHGRESVLYKVLNADVRYYFHVAIPSSVVLIDKVYFHNSNGFNENYTGYGYEDLDFILRVDRDVNPDNYKGFDLHDEFYRCPLFSSGFRACIAKSMLNVVLDKGFFFHQYHERIKNDEFKITRERNKNIFHNINGIRNRKKTLELKDMLIDYFPVDSLQDEHKWMFEVNKGSFGKIDTLKQKIKYVIGL